MVDIEKIVRKFLQESLPVVLVGKAQEGRRLITVRFLGYIKEINEYNNLVFHRFKPFLPMFVFKNDNNIKAVFSLSPENSYETLLKVKEIDTNELYTHFPDKAFISRPIRIEPSPKKPVILYVLSLGDATNSCEVINISEKGVCFVSEREYNENGQYGFTIILPDQLGIITCYGEIKYKKPDRTGFFRYGVELFTHPKDRAVIARYIMIREKEIMDILRGF
jgi:hypothetical protein